ncbi:MAG: hypothetical protein Q8Q60_01965 [Candidatus Chromulinivorax sp.]|nr:hypothetical protein [Candidatus Chromulinivorax sp.]
MKMYQLSFVVVLFIPYLLVASHEQDVQVVFENCRQNLRGKFYDPISLEDAANEVSGVINEIAKSDTIAIGVKFDTPKTTENNRHILLFILDTSDKDFTGITPCAFACNESQLNIEGRNKFASLCLQRLLNEDIRSKVKFFGCSER